MRVVFVIYLLAYIFARESVKVPLKPLLGSILPKKQLPSGQIVCHNVTGLDFSVRLLVPLKGLRYERNR
jgi:hypothetical protein